MPSGILIKKKQRFFTAYLPVHVVRFLTRFPKSDGIAQKVEWGQAVS